MMNTPLEMRELLRQVVALAEEAGSAVMKIYAEGDFATTYKSEGSPLTCADMASHDLIVEGLSRLTPTIPVLSEESQDTPYEVRQTWRVFWLVDPLDGTKEFIERNGEFTVNIALVQDGRPVLGVVCAPAMEVTYLAAQGVGAFKKNPGGEMSSIAVSEDEPAPLMVVVSRSHPSEDLQKLLDRMPTHQCVRMGSSLKICLVAEGAAHLYPRLGPTMEWDTAAAQCVAEIAGASVTDLAGLPLRYNKPDMHNSDFLVTGSPSFGWQRCIEGNEAATSPQH